MHPIFLLNLNSQLATLFLFPVWLFYDGYTMWCETINLAGYTSGVKKYILNI